MSDFVTLDGGTITTLREIVMVTLVGVAAMVGIAAWVAFFAAMDWLANV
jgi:hypothetical protein